MIAALLLIACGSPSPVAEPEAPAVAAPAADVAGSPAPAPSAKPVLGAPEGAPPIDWAAPDESTIPAGPLGDSIRRGKDLFTRTNELLPDYDPSSLTCQSCHLDAGRQPYAVPMVGAYARFPKYMERTGAVITLQDRVNYCFTRSLAGSRIPMESREMTDLVAYVAWLSQGIPVGKHIEGEALPPIKEKLNGDATRGEQLFQANCVACHQADGQGVPGAFPALWGPKSYSTGASMAREERAATFIVRFMPKSNPGSLSTQDAFDLSAFVNSHPRPDSPAKNDDWPSGGTPYDVPYGTSDHEAFRPPAELVPRAKPELAVVPKPPPIAAVTGASGGGK